MHSSFFNSFPSYKMGSKNSPQHPRIHSASVHPSYHLTISSVSDVCINCVCACVCVQVGVGGVLSPASKQKSPPLKGQEASYFADSPGLFEGVSPESSTHVAKVISWY